MDETMLRGLFQRPADRPLQRPRFGGGRPSSPATLHPEETGAHRFEDRPPRPLFDRQVDLPELGVTVRVVELEGERAGELTAIADSTDSGHLGRRVVVGLVGADDRIRRVTVTLDQDAPPGCLGEAPVGRVDELREAIGDEATVVACLLD